MNETLQFGGSEQQTEGAERYRVEERAEIRLAKNYQIYTDIYLPAAAKTVWRILTDFDRMPDWSSTLQGIDGEFANQSQVKVAFRANGEDWYLDHSLQVTPGESFGWSDEFMPGIVDNHQYRVQKLSQHTSRFIQTDSYRTDLPQHQMRAHMESTVALFTTFNRELRAEVERQLSKER